MKDLPELPYLINDADNHFLEPLDMYERYIEPKWRDKAVRIEVGPDGREVESWAGRPSRMARGRPRRRVRSRRDSLRPRVMMRSSVRVMVSGGLQESC